MNQSARHDDAVAGGPMRPMTGERRLARRAAGFTLVEVLIVTVVVAILAAVAYPTYTGQVRRAQRAEAQTALMRAAQQLERSFTQEGRYPAAADFPRLYGGAAGASVYSGADRPLDAGSGKFQITYRPGPGNPPVDYTLTATPKSNAIPDSDCANFGLDSRGRRLVAGSTPTAGSPCWR